MTSVRELLHLKPGALSIREGANPIRAFQDEVNKLFNDYFGEVSLPTWLSRDAFNISPLMDISENTKAYKVTAELPGMDAKDVQISIANGYVTIKGEKKQESKEEKEGYFRQERSFGSFQRVASLPENADIDKAEASFKNGVLTITAPKKAGAQSKERKLEIKTAA